MTEVGSCLSFFYVIGSENRTKVKAGDKWVMGPKYGTVLHVSDELIALRPDNDVHAQEMIPEDGAKIIIIPWFLGTCPVKVGGV